MRRQYRCRDFMIGNRNCFVGCLYRWFSFSLLVVGWGERMTGRNFRRETASGRRKEMLREEVFRKRRMAAHTPVLRNTTVRSIPSAMPVKSVRNRLPEDFFRVVEACVSRRRVVSRAKEERFRRPVWLARLSDCRCRRKVWFVSSHVRRSARSLIPVTMSESSCFSARIAARPLRAV